MSTSIDALVEGAQAALAEYASFTQEQVDHIVKKASVAALHHHGDLAVMAVEETKRGLFEDKAVKNMFACEHVTNSIINQKTVGVISHDEITGITEIADPVGVICALTPVTNPTSTAIFKSLIALKTRNPIIFGFHPSAQKCSVAAAKIVRDAAVAAGAPENCIQWIEDPSMEASGALMNHPGVALILATGGNAMVRAAYSCGKPALGVGAGNVPAFIERSAKVGRAVNDIVLSKSFDMGMVCASEQAVILDEPIAEEALAEFARLHAYRASADEKRMLEEFIFGVTADSENCAGAKLNPAVVGQSPQWIAEHAGFSVPEDTSIILADVTGVGPQEPLTREKLAPVLAVLRASSPAEGIDLARQMVDFDGLGHSGAIHSNDQDVIAEFGKVVKAVRIIENSPSALGGIGDIYNAFMPSLTLGCGSYGHNSVSNNVSAVNLLNVKRIGRRNNNLQWFKIPAKTYFEPNAVRYLSDMREKFFDVRKRAFKFPELGKLAKLVCIPTTSGTGSEMTPFAVITDDETGMKYPLADYALTPSVAIIDPEFTRVLPGFLVADAGFDALTHATEAFVSVYANDYTDGLCLHAIKLIFENIERSAKAQPGSTDAEDIKAREKMHNAASISGMAFGNSFLGIVHAMAHVTGATYHLVHGRTNAVYLPHVIRYNGQVPTKLNAWPKYERYIAPERFQEIAKHLGLPASTPEEGVESYARAVEELRDKVGIERSFQAQGVDETTFISGLHDLAMAAYGDQCAPANPRMPMIADMETLMEAAYYGTSFDEVRAARKGAEVASDAVTGTVTTVKAAKGARRKTNA